ncbi:MAG: beta-mannosidase, partial [Ruminiclostridium sp.]
ILCIEKARLKSVYISQKHKENSVELDFDIAPVTYSGDIGDFDINISVTDTDGVKLLLEKNIRRVVMRDPKLWWPKGYGKQPLYSVSVELAYKGTVLDKWEKKIGLRTMTVTIEKDQWGEAFA